MMRFKYLPIFNKNAGCEPLEKANIAFFQGRELDVRFRAEDIPGFIIDRQ
jgi:hypothetical protein